MLQVEGRLGLNTHRGPGAERAAVNPSAMPLVRQAGRARSGPRHATIGLIKMGHRAPRQPLALPDAVLPPAWQVARVSVVAPDRSGSMSPWSSDSRQTSTLHTKAELQGWAAPHCSLPEGVAKDMLPTGSSGPQLLMASDKPASWGQFCSPVSCKKLRKSREKLKHPKFAASALLPLAARVALAAIPNLHVCQPSCLNAHVT